MPLTHLLLPVMLWETFLTRCLLSRVLKNGSYFRIKQDSEQQNNIRTSITNSLCMFCVRILVIIHVFLFFFFLQHIIELLDPRDFVLKLVSFYKNVTEALISVKSCGKMLLSLIAFQALRWNPMYVRYFPGVSSFFCFLFHFTLPCKAFSYFFSVSTLFTEQPAKQDRLPNPPPPPSTSSPLKKLITSLSSHEGGGL